MGEKIVEDGDRDEFQQCLFCNTCTTADVCADCLQQRSYQSTHAQNEASSDYTHTNRAPLKRRSELWRDVKRRVVPDSDPSSPKDVDLLYEFLDKSTKVVALTGAGISRVWNSWLQKVNSGSDIAGRVLRLRKVAIYSDI